jgi:5-methylcytosine-specific restriction endonuclease McrA
MSRKKPSIKSVEKKLTGVCYEYVKLRDKNTCQHCERHVEGSNAHPSHVIPKSRSKLLRWDDANIKVLCFYCHMHWWHQNPLKAGEWFRDRFPHRAKYVEEHEKESLKSELTKSGSTYREWLDEWIWYYEGKIEDERTTTQ